MNALRCVSVLFLLCAAAAHGQPVDTLLTNGQIYTADGSWAEALAISKGVIVAIGDSATLQSRRGAATNVIDLRGRTVLPGFHDMHIHPLGAGQLMRSCVLKREATPDEIRTTVAACAAKAKPGQWITGGMWVNDVFKDEPQDRKLLDEAAPDNPVVLMDETGHSSWANSLALKLAGITRETPDPLNGAIEHRPDGEPNGLLRESAARLVRTKVPPATIEENAAALSDALQTILSSGITSLQDAMASRETLSAFALLSDRGELEQRVKACIGWSYNASGVDQNFEAIYNERSLYRRPRLAPDCVKIANDGVPGEGHTAAMLDPYAEPVPGDEGDTRRFGIVNAPPDVLSKAVTRFDRDGMSMLIHCTGDACARAAVDAIAAARKANGWSGVLHQIGHNNFTTTQDLQRGRDLGATFEFSAYLYYWNGVTRTYLKAIGPERFERFKPVRETIDLGSLALEGSDWPVSPTPNPWIAIETLVTRKRPGGSEEPPLAPKQAITLAEAIDIYTVNAAKQFGHADQVGAIKTGLFADLIVLDRNPFKVPVTTVHQTRVEMALINGEVVYQAGANDLLDTSGPMTHEKFARYVQLFNKHDLRFVDYYTPDVVFDKGSDDGVLRGRQAIADWYRDIWTDLDQIIAVDAVAIDNDRNVVIAEVLTTLAAKRDGVQRPGMSLARGDRLITNGVVVYTLENGLIKSLRGAARDRYVERAQK